MLWFSCTSHANTWESKAEKHIPTLTREAHYVWGIEAPIPIMAAQIHAESAWNENVKSTRWCYGLSPIYAKHGKLDA